MFFVEDGKYVETTNTDFVVEDGKYAELLPSVFLVEDGKFVELMGGGISRLVYIDNSGGSTKHSKYSDDLGTTWVEVDNPEEITSSNPMRAFSAASDGSIICFTRTKYSSSTNNPLLGYTKDGINYTLLPNTVAYDMGTSSDYITYIPETKRFVVVNPSMTGNGKILYSTDGVNWTAVSVPSNRLINPSPVIYDADNGYYMLTQNDKILSSTNLSSWGTAWENEYYAICRGVARGNGRTIAIVDSMETDTYFTYTLYSVDGKTWTIDSYNHNPQFFYDIVFVKDRFFSVVTFGQGYYDLYYSFDGITWTRCDGLSSTTRVGTLGSYSNIIDMGDKLVFYEGSSGAGRKFYTSYDGGISWEQTGAVSGDGTYGPVSYLE